MKNKFFFKTKLNLEYYFIYFIYILLSGLPIRIVSFLGGSIFKLIGPLTKTQKIVKKNYLHIFPYANKIQILKHSKLSWFNTGKTFFELLILPKIISSKNNITLEGLNIIENIKKNKQQVIFIGIHESNWEILLPTIDKFGISVGGIYRHINNPYIDKFILNIRTKTLQTNKTFYTPKGKESAKNIINAINKGLSMILLIDQKDNAGNNIKLFDYYVKTQLGFLKIAYKYNLKLIPVQVIRKKINNFSIIFHPQLDLLLDNKNEINSMTKIHNIIEKWIKDHPDQWLWQHKRFG